MRQEVIQKAPERAKKQTPNLTGIPTQMKLDFERRSGLSFDDVRVHYNSDKPRKIGALAYTQGNQVHVGPGQERHLRHELGHVVQQKRGIVRPTGTLQGKLVNTDPMLERQANCIFSNQYALNQSNISSSYKMRNAAQRICQFEFGDYYSPYIAKIEQYYRDCCTESSLEQGEKVSLKRETIIIEMRLMNGAEPAELANELKDKINGLGWRTRTHYEAIINILRTDSEAIQNTVNTEIDDYCGMLLSSKEFVASFYSSIAQRPPARGYRKAYLRRLGQERDKKLGNIDGITSFPHLTKSHVVRPLAQQYWTTSINDAYVGKLIDMGVYFRIDDIPDTLKEEIETISKTSTDVMNKIDMLLERFKHYDSDDPHKGIFSSVSDHPYTVLAREIAQLMLKGYIFRCVMRREKDGKKDGLGDIKLVAFKDEYAFFQYMTER